MQAQILPFRPAQPVVSEASRWSEAIESVTASNLKIGFAWQRMWFRLLLGALVLVAVSGCASLPGLGGDITEAQAKYLDTQRQIAEDRNFHQRQVVASLAAFAGSDNPVVQAWALSSIERIAGPQQGAQPAPQAQPQDGPITAVVRAVLPLAVPLAQLWTQDRAGERSLTQALGNMDLIGNLAGQIAKDPLVVTQPDPTIIHAPAPVIVDREVPVIIDREVPVFAPTALP